MTPGGRGPHPPDAVLRSPTAEELAWDDNQSRGQVRPVDGKHVQELKEIFTRNRPDVLDLVVLVRGWCVP